MFIFRLCILVILLTSHLLSASAQQRGQILKAGDSVLDPNGDGFVTSSGGPFSIDGYYVDEFEYIMFGLPFAGDGETDGDAVQSCATTDLATDTTGFSAYGVLEGDNLIFRFRLAGNRPSVESYTILIDTDNKIGTADPNYTPDNPGFEVDITLIKSQSKGVFVYDIDGADNCPAILASYPFSTHFQSSVAGTTSCNDPDYFYDFYIPFQVLTDEFGITAQTEIRFVAVTNVSATCAMSGNISDVGGVNDDDYTSLEDMFIALSDSQCPTALEDLCQTCDGFKVGVTQKPEINQPVKVGEHIISGTSEALANIFVSVFDGAGASVEDITTNSDVNGEWELTLSLPLENEDSITARAQIPGSCSSGISESDISFAVVIINTPPTVSGSTGTLNYTENDPPISIFGDLSISDVDDTEMDSAWLTVTANYNVAEDIINLPPGQGLNISWEAPLNRVRIFGLASIEIYESVIKGITYSNTSDNPDLSTRSFSISVHDGLDESNILSRDLNLTRTNDAPILEGDAVTINYNESSTDVVIDNTITISDIDDTSLEGAIISFSQGYDQAEDTLQFTDQNGIAGSFDDVNGILTLSGTASIADYQAALRSIKYENLDAGNDPVEVIDDGTTRIINFQVDDGEDLSNIHVVSIDIDIAPNVAPVFVDNLTDQNPVDTVVIELLEDTILDTCLAAIDADGDLVNLQPGFTYEENRGVAVLTGGLCFSFTPDQDYEGSEYITFTGCDNSTDPACDVVVVEINMIPVNDLPEIVDGSNNPIDTIYYNATEDTPSNFCIMANDVEVDALELAEVTTFTGNSSSTIPTPSSLCFNYVPALDFFGYDTLQLVVCEQGSTTQCDTIIAVIEVEGVNDAPVVQVEGVPVDTVYFDAFEDVVTQLCLSVMDPDMDNIQVVEAYKTEGPGLFEHLPLGDLCFFFQSEKDSTGLVYGEIIVCDDSNPALCDTIIAAVNVLQVNDGPVILDENGNPLFEQVDTLFYVINEDMPFDFCINARDPDGDPYSLNAAVTVDGNGDYVITDPNNLCLTFTPAENFNGIEHGTLTICETVGIDPQCASIAVAFEILPVNDAPIIQVDSGSPDTLFYSTNEDVPIEFCVIANDIEGNLVTLDVINSSTTDGIFDIGNPDDLCASFTPATNFNGEVTGEIIVCDDQNPAGCDTVTLVINVIPVNDPPVILDENLAPIINDTLFLETQEDEPLEYCLTVNDPEGDVLELITLISIGTDNGIFAITDPNNSCFNYTPNPDFNGRQVGEATICEFGGGLCSSSIIVVDVVPVNDPPVLTENGSPVDTVYYSIDEDNQAVFCLEGIDTDVSDVLSIAEINPGSSDAMFSPDATGLCFQFVPNPNFYGTVSAEIIVCDDGSPSLCDTLVVIVEVLPVNDSPVFISPEIVSDTLRISTLEDIDVEFCLDVTDPDSPIQGNPVLTSITNLGQYTFTSEVEYCYTFSPLSQISGIEYATLQVCDPEGLCTSLVVEIEIEQVNDPPVGEDDFFEHDIYTSFSGDLTENDSDPEGTRLQVSLNDGSQLNGTLELSSDGTFKYTPGRDFVGTEIFTYELCDNGSPQSCIIVNVTFELYDPLIIWQAVSPNGDNMNDVWIIEGIELFPENQVKIFDRYGNLVYEIEGYDNVENVWFGQSNRGIWSDESPDGTYFYSLDLGDEKMSKPLSGFIILKKD